MEADEKIAPRSVIVLGVVALVAGALAGVAGALFRLALDWVTRLRLDLVAYAHQWPALGWLLPVISAAAAVALARFLVRLQPLAAGSGVQRVEAVMRDEAEPAPTNVVPVKFIGGALSIGAGMVLGREGPTVQMGSVIGSTLGRWLHLGWEDIRPLQAATAGAGLAVAFNAPLGGAIFVFEEVAHFFKLPLAITTLVACGTAMAVAQRILGDAMVFKVGPIAVPGLAQMVPYLALGLLLGVLGVAYNRVVVAGLDRFKQFGRLPLEVRAAIVGGVIGLLGWFDPAFVGGGEALNQQVLNGGLPLATLALLLLLRWFVGPLSYAVGTPGGLFAPLLVVGALAGSLYAGVLHLLLPWLSLDPTACAIVGMAAFFVGVVRAPFTGITLVVEMTATTTLFVPLLLASFGAMLAATLLGGAPIYDTLRQRMLLAGVAPAQPAASGKPDE